MGSDLAQKKQKPGAAASISGVHLQRGFSGEVMRDNQGWDAAFSLHLMSNARKLHKPKQPEQRQISANLGFQQPVKPGKNPAGPTQPLDRQTEEVAETLERISGLLLNTVPV